MTEGTESDYGTLWLGGLGFDRWKSGEGIIWPLFCSTFGIVPNSVLYSKLRAKLVDAYRGLGGAPQHCDFQDQISIPLQTKRSVALGVAGKSLSLGVLVS